MEEGLVGGYVCFFSLVKNEFVLYADFMSMVILLINYVIRYSFGQILWFLVGSK